MLISVVSGKFGVFFLLFFCKMPNKILYFRIFIIVYSRILFVVGTYIRCQK